VSHRLIVTNGMAAVNALQAAGITGDFCAWNDVLHDGPVPGSLDDSALARVRAQFIADRGWGALEEIHAWFVERDARLDAAPNFPEVVLWFEHDLYDQLQLIQVLSRLSDGRSNVSIVQQRRFIGEATQEELRADFKSRAPATLAQFGSATMAWAAFRSSTPAAVEALLASGRTEPLPYLAPALRRWYATFPDAEGGLSRTERRTLELVRDGTQAPLELYRATSQAEDAVFRGDASYWILLGGLATGDHPLLAVQSGAPFTEETVADLRLDLTADGRSVLAGQADRIDLNGIDSWRGGIHLTTASHWRWSAATGFQRRDRD